MEIPMLSSDVYYQKEKKHTRNRLMILSVITFLSFGISSEIIPQILLVRLVLGVLVFISMLHYSFITYQAEKFIPYRKNILIFLDLFTLTLLIYAFEQYGLFLFPIYILLVLQNALCFGKEYLYTTMLSAVISWVFLSIYSPYWHLHYDIIITYAMTTLLVALLFWKVIAGEEEEIDGFKEILDTVKENDENYDTLKDIANRTMYKEVIKKRLKEKESFTLLFINLHKNDAHDDHIRRGVLREVANRLIISIDKDDFLAQLGDDEFVIITTRQRVFLRKFLKKIEDNVIGYHHINDINTRIELSIGVSLYPEDGQTEMIISKCADEAMRAARENPNLHHMFYGGIKGNTE